MTEKTFQQGEVIFREGEVGMTMYHILDGGVAIYANYGKENQQRLTDLKPGDFFGEMAIIESYPRSASAVALDSGVRVEEITRDELGSFFEEQPQMILRMLHHLSKRLRSLTKDYREVSATIAEMNAEKNKKRSEGLLSRIQKFASVYMASFRKDEESVESQREQQHGTDTGFVKQKETYSKGTVIFKEGETGKCMYCLQSGSVGIYTGYGTEREEKLAELQPNQYFGEMGMLEGEARSATAVALENDTVVEVFYESFLSEMFEKNPTKVLMVFEHLSRRLRKLTKSYLDACKLVYIVSDAEDNQQPVSEEIRLEAARYSRVRVNGYYVYL